MLRMLYPFALLIAILAGPSHAREPVIDMHMHADTVADYPPGMGYCVPLMAMDPALDHSRDYGEQYMDAWRDSGCENPLVAAKSDEELLEWTIERLEANNAIALLQGPPDRVKAWMQAAPGRFVPSVSFTIGREDHENLEWMRELFTNGGFVMLGEVGNQYRGIAPNDSRMDEVWAMVAELDIPVGYHMGTGPPAAITMYPEYRVWPGNPLLLEDVLARHPNLRISIQHMATGFHDELKMMLWTYPQLYVETSGPITWSEDFHTYMQDLIDAGLENRILFGVDALIWPEMLDRSISIIEEADYLTEAQKRKILFDNAVRFLKLDPANARARAMGQKVE